MKSYVFSMGAMLLGDRVPLVTLDERTLIAKIAFGVSWPFIDHRIKIGTVGPFIDHRSLKIATRGCGICLIHNVTTMSVHPKIRRPFQIGEEEVRLDELRKLPYFALTAIPARLLLFLINAQAVLESIALFESSALLNPKPPFDLGWQMETILVNPSFFNESGLIRGYDFAKKRFDPICDDFSDHFVANIAKADGPEVLEGGCSLTFWNEVDEVMIWSIRPSMSSGRSGCEELKSSWKFLRKFPQLTIVCVPVFLHNFANGPCHFVEDFGIRCSEVWASAFNWIGSHRASGGDGPLVELGLYLELLLNITRVEGVGEDLPSTRWPGEVGSFQMGPVQEVIFITSYLPFNGRNEKVFRNSYLKKTQVAGPDFLLMKLPRHRGFVTGTLTRALGACRRRGMMAFGGGGLKPKGLMRRVKGIVSCARELSRSVGSIGDGRVVCVCSCDPAVLILCCFPCRADLTFPWASIRFSCCERRGLDLTVREMERKITIGVCVMEKKVVIFGDKVILEDPVERYSITVVIFGDKVILEDPVERYSITVVIFGDKVILEDPVERYSITVVIFGDKVILEDPVERYANVRTPDCHVRTRLYFTSESHIHSLMNVLRYCNLDDSLQGEDNLVCDSGLEQLYKTKELDYMSYIVLRMFENTEMNDSEATSLHQEHTLPIMGPERLQEVGSYLTLEKMEKMIRPFSMPAEDFPPPSTPQGFSGYFSKSATVLERLVNLWPFNKHGYANGGKK
ncbi:hypothetical protein CRG98_042376 [Punica granatum]|uniref:Inositol hexakisphosphate and diphosphoinositol-pentakisphosphate kinase n=1 Tax=Punica granatum TaxID=22663 RepID=A0A2I0HZS7_PUNGR|nr:hypothetical protein CRG98_042376 [Punica granatum]